MAASRTEGERAKQVGWRSAIVICIQKLGIPIKDENPQIGFNFLIYKKNNFSYEERNGFADILYAKMPSARVALSTG